MPFFVDGCQSRYGMTSLGQNQALRHMRLFLSKSLHTNMKEFRSQIFISSCCYQKRSSSPEVWVFVYRHFISSTTEKRCCFFWHERSFLFSVRSSGENSLITFQGFCIEYWRSCSPAWALWAYSAAFITEMPAVNLDCTKTICRSIKGHGECTHRRELLSTKFS